MEKDKLNNAQKTREKKGYNDPNKKEEKSKGISGTDIPVTWYSDGSSTYHFGGPCGSQDYDENGEEC